MTRCPAAQSCVVCSPPAAGLYMEVLLHLQLVTMHCRCSIFHLHVLHLRKCSRDLPCRAPMSYLHSCGAAAEAAAQSLEELRQHLRVCKCGTDGPLLRGVSRRANVVIANLIIRRTLETATPNACNEAAGHRAIFCERSRMIWRLCREPRPMHRCIGRSCTAVRKQLASGVCQCAQARARAARFGRADRNRVVGWRRARIAAAGAMRQAFELEAGGPCGSLSVTRRG